MDSTFSPFSAPRFSSVSALGRGMRFVYKYIPPNNPPELTNPSQNCFRKQIFVLKFDLFVNLFVMNFPFAWLPARKVGGFLIFGG